MIVQPPLVACLGFYPNLTDPLAVATLGLLQLSGELVADADPAFFEAVGWDADATYSEERITPSQPRVAPNRGITLAEYQQRKRPSAKYAVSNAEAAVLKMVAHDAEAEVTERIERPYSTGVTGAITSAQTVAAMAKRAMLDQTVRTWAVQQLRSSNGHLSGPLDHARRIFEGVRAFVTPVRDPVGTEWITYPADLIKSEAPAGDCDCQVLLFVSAVQSVGIPAAVVLQMNGDEAPHLCCAVWDDARWVYCDPARRDLPFGKKRPCQKEIWISLNGESRVFVNKDMLATAPAPRSPQQGVFIGVGDIDPVEPDPVLVDMVPAAVPGQAQAGAPWWFSFLVGVAVGAFATCILHEVFKSPDKNTPEQITTASR